MIKSKNDLELYLHYDKIAQSITKKKPSILGDEIWKFTIALRKLEYYTNVYVPLGNILRLFWHIKYKILSLMLGFTIPINVIEEGLCIYHYGYIVISKYAKIGKWCSIHSGVNIGQNWSSSETPKIGDFCFIGPGVKMFGGIKLADRIVIGANSVVNRSFEESDITIAGVPARVVKRTGYNPAELMKRVNNE